MFLKIFITILKLIALVSAAWGVSLLKYPLQLHLSGTIYEFELRVVIFALVVVLGVLFFIWRILFSLLQAPKDIRNKARARIEDQSYKALTQGFVAAATGDLDEAKELLHTAQKKLKDKPLVTLLEAQTAFMEGDKKVAHDHFKKLLSDQQSEHYGLKGLATEQIALKNYDKALGFMKRAYQLKPKSRWVLSVYEEMNARVGHYDFARLINQQRAGYHFIDREESLRLRTLYLVAEAQELVDQAESLNVTAIATPILAKSESSTDRLEVHPMQSMSARDRRAQMKLELKAEKALKKHKEPKKSRSERRIQKRLETQLALLKEGQGELLSSEQEKAQKAVLEQQASLLAQAEKLLKQALLLDPELPQVQQLYLRLLAVQKHENKSLALIKMFWKEQERIDLIDPALKALKSLDLKPMKQKAFVYDLVSLHPESALGKYFLAKQAVDLELWEEAYTLAQASLELGASFEVYALLSQISLQREEGSALESQRLYAQALKSPRAPEWLCSECYEVFERWELVCSHCEHFASVDLHRPELGNRFLFEEVSLQIEHLTNHSVVLDQSPSLPVLSIEHSESQELVSNDSSEQEVEQEAEFSSETPASSFSEETTGPLAEQAAPKVETEDSTSQVEESGDTKRARWFKRS